MRRLLVLASLLLLVGVGAMDSHAAQKKPEPGTCICFCGPPIDGKQLCICVCSTEG